MKKTLIITLVLIATLLLSVSCDDNQSEEKDYSIYQPFTLEFPAYGEVINATVTFENAENINLKYLKKSEGEIKPVTDGKIENIKAGDVIYLYATRTSVDNEKYLRIRCDRNCFVYGNVMSLIKQSNFHEETAVFPNAFRELFKDNTNIRSHFSEKLLFPATTLAAGCYQSMFEGCTGLNNSDQTMVISATQMADSACLRMFAKCYSLRFAPKLDISVMADSCCEEMFADCSRLEKALDIHAAEMKYSCCYRMFINCTTLDEAPLISATVMADNCCESMFQGCTGLTKAQDITAETLAFACCRSMFSGTNLTKAPKLYAMTMAKNCYASMFKNCKNLTEASDLPADTLAESCYQEMFYGCEKLTEVPDLPAIKAEENCYAGMFTLCTSLTEPPVVSATESANGFCIGMFNGCAQLKSSPVLQAKELSDYCYREMFRDCQNLKSITCLNTSFAGIIPFNDWSVGVGSGGILYCAEGMKDRWATDHDYNVPTGWTVEEYTP
jgi:hypothetical protein